MHRHRFGRQSLGQKLTLPCSNLLPRQGTRPLKDFIDDKLIKLDAPIGAAMYEAMRPVLVDEMRQAVATMVDAAARTMQPAGLSALAHVVSPRNGSNSSLIDPLSVRRRKP
ncbi:MAG: hypothetical protein HY777_09860 [Betaproteobacteria bacterium]|nr:hypothetical protein [Betaproteobacteria bacterium]